MVHEAFGSVTAVLRAYWPVALGSFGMTLVATPVCRWFARRHRIVDRPDDFLKPHKRPIPYLGGVAIFLGWALGLVVAIFDDRIPVRQTFVAGVLVGGLAIMAIGLFDDIRLMAPRVKLVLNTIVGLFLLWIGAGRSVFASIVHATAIGNDPSAHWLILCFSVPFALFIVVGACNATNLLDGLDGLCGGVLGIISLGFFMLALHMVVYNPQDVAGHERIVLALAMLGAAMGFLPYNINPASIFMGDAGSMLLGLNAAVIILMFCDIGIIRWMLGAIMVFGLPIADMTLTLLRRWRNGRPIMEGDRSHFYDQLVDRGYTVRQVVAISYALAMAFAVLGCTAAMFVRTRYAILIYAGAVVAVVLAVWKLDMVGIMPARPSVPGDAPSERNSRTS